MSEEFEGLSLVELIDLLEDPQEPPEIPLTPQTPGWIVLGVIAAVLLFLLIRWAVRKYRAGAYRRAALRELKDAGEDPAATAAILRRAALCAYPREKVASLAGADWLAFLDRKFPGTGFADGPGQVFATAPYRASPPDPKAAALARTWIKRHRADPGDG